MMVRMVMMIMMLIMIMIMSGNNVFVMILVQKLQYQIDHCDCNGSRDNDNNDDDYFDGVAWALDAVDGADTDSLVPSLHKVAGDIPPRIPAGWYAFNP